MASERQIAANRHNARKSSGPRSGAGKERARRNAYRHGLASALLTNTQVAKQLEKLAHKIAGNTEDAGILERARVIAQAEFDLARVRRAKLTLLARVMAFGDLRPAQASSSVTEDMRLLSAIARAEVATIPKRIDSSAMMPTQEPEQSAEAVRQALPELIKLDRYERRFRALRDHAVLALVRLDKHENRTV
jgi:hypothetical protein